MTTSPIQRAARARTLLPLALSLTLAGACSRAPASPPAPVRTVPAELRCADAAACVRRDGVEVRAESSAPFAEPVLVDVLEAVSAGRRAYTDLLGAEPSPVTVRLATASPDSAAVRRERAANGALTITLPVGALPKSDDPVFAGSAARRARWEASDAWLAAWQARVAPGRDSTAMPAWVRAGLLALVSDRPRAREAHLRYQSEDRLPVRDLPANVQVPAAPPVARAARGREGSGWSAGPGGRSGGPRGSILLDVGGEGLRLPLTDLAVAQAASVLTYLERTVGKPAFAELLRRLANGEPLAVALRAAPGAPADVEALGGAWESWLKRG